MQALIDIIAGVVALIAAAALSLFGVDMSPPQKSSPEIHRVRDCGDAGASSMLTTSGERSRNC